MARLLEQNLGVSKDLNQKPFFLDLIDFFEPFHDTNLGMYSHLIGAWTDNKGGLIALYMRN